MSREAIESFVDEIRNDLPKIRRALAIIHACPDDHDSLLEAHRLTHSIKGTAALIGIMTLSQIAHRQEQLLELLIDGRLTMDDRLRDTLERITDVIESYADGLHAGTVPEQKLLEVTLTLHRRHTVEEPFAAELVEPLELIETSRVDEGLAGDVLSQSDAASSDPVNIEVEVLPAEHPVDPITPEVQAATIESQFDNVPAAEAVIEPDSDAEQFENFRDEAIEHLRVVAGMLATYRRDRMRWDLLADVRRRIHSLKGAAGSLSCSDFATLAHHAEDLLQRLLDRSIPPTESAADCLQACVDALEERLDGELDESILNPLHERLNEMCGVTTDRMPKVESDQEAVVSQDSVATLARAWDTPEDTHALGERGYGEAIREAGVRESEAPAEPRTVEEHSSAGASPSPVSDSRSEVEICSAKPASIPKRTDPATIELDDRGSLSEEMLEVFVEEVEDHLRLIDSAFAALKKSPGKMSLIQDVRRSAHTIKGAAGSVGLKLLSRLAHRMEDLLDQLFESQQPVTPNELALLFDTTDTLQDLTHGHYADDGMRVTVAQLLDSFDALLAGRTSHWQPIEVNSESTTVETTSEGTTPHAVIVGHNESLTENRAANSTTRERVVDVSEQATREQVIDDLDHSLARRANSEETSAEVVASEPAAIEPPTEVEPAAPAESRELVVQDVLPMLAAWNRLAEPSGMTPAQLVTESSVPDEQKRQSESLRVPLIRIDSLMREVGELIINRSAFEQRMADFARCVDELQRASVRMRNTSQELDTKYGVGALDGRRALWGDGASLLPGGKRRSGRHDDEFDSLELDRYTDFHLLSRSMAEATTDLGTVGNELRNLIGDFDQLLNRQGRLSRDTQDRLMRIRMVPLATLTTKLHRTVRVVAGQQSKQVDFLIQGGDVELDKLVIEELADPLMHILRNAVDHGIEVPAVRSATAKSERATIRVQAFYQGTRVVIRVSDDGSGLNFDSIREKAVRTGLTPAGDTDNLSDEELAAFIFLPGFSTAHEVSEVSGRGVGMDIVRDKVQKLKGSVSVESKAGQGTTFTIRLPMTMAVTRALLIHASNEMFALPMQSVVQILRLERKDIEQLGQNPILRLGDEALSLIYLADKLRLRNPADKSSSTIPVLILASGEQKVAVAVDKILHGRDIVVKTLGSHLRKVKGMIGATLMGDGSVVPILDAADLVGSSGTVTRPSRVPAPHLIPKRKEHTTIMVVDDSVSVRRVMTNLLKNNGWNVLDAKDGLDALEKLRKAERQPDMFLLDIEMPRMDGYELLTSLRSHLEYRDTPIVMVTSRAGDKHRQKAMQLGASDYVIKPYQDSELLSLIRRSLAQAAANKDREAVLV